MPTNYIGLANTSHDPAIAIVDGNGEVVFAEDCERYLQNKRAWGAIADDFHRSEKLINKYCHPGADIVTASSWRANALRWGRVQANVIFPLMRDILLFLKGKNMTVEEKWWLDYHILTSKFVNGGTQAYIGSNIAYRNHVRELYKTPNTTKKTYYHHLTHAATACFTCPFEECACLIVDGYGEDTSVAFYYYKDGEIKRLPFRNKSFNASLGYFYASVCWVCGFDPFAGEEWKVMGLAPYGKFNEDIYKILQKSIRFEDGCLVPGERGFMNSEFWPLRRGPHQSPLEAADIAYTAQHYFCELVFKLADRLHDVTRLDNLAMGGGCALNSACNGRIADSTKFKNLHVFAAPGDNGNALGAAWLAFLEDNPDAGRKLARRAVHSPYLGSKISDSSLRRFVTHGGTECLELSDDDLVRTVAQFISDGKIIGWVQGRAEFGPRALGNRSILADPRDAGMKDRLNAFVKYREEFRPFAPAILHECGEEYFINYQETPYMERALVFREEVRHKVPAVVHVDNTGRLQSVKREWNERYYDLIKAFDDITGVPIVLNTSFNLMGKPIIHSFEDALSVFLTSGIDVLVVGNMVVEKGRPAAGRLQAHRGGNTALLGDVTHV